MAKLTTKPCRALKDFTLGWLTTRKQLIRRVRKTNPAIANLLEEADRIYSETQRGLLAEAHAVGQLWNVLTPERQEEAARIIHNIALTSQVPDMSGIDPLVRGAVEARLDFMARVPQKLKEVYLRKLDYATRRSEASIREQYAGNEAVLQEKLTELHKDTRAQRTETEKRFEKFSNRPYDPSLRFGKIIAGVKVKAKGVYAHPEIDGETLPLDADDYIMVNTFDSSNEAEAALADMKKTFSSKTYKFTLHELPKSLYEQPILPEMLIGQLEKKLELTAEQRGLLREFRLAHSRNLSFAKRFLPKKGIAGSSLDKQRVFSTYTLEVASTIARLNTEPILDETNIEMQKARIAAANESNHELELDLSKIANITEESWRDTFSPDLSFVKLRQVATLWHLGFNFASAMVNTLQVPMATVPFLSAEFGTKGALTGISRSYSDIRSLLSKERARMLTPSQVKFVNLARRAGFIDDTMSMALVDAMSSPGFFQGSRNLWDKTIHSGMWLFSQAERVNRYVTGMTAFDLALQNPTSVEVQKMGDQREAIRRLTEQEGMNFNEAKAYLYAEQAIEITQGNYMLQNRPKAFRGGERWRTFLPLFTLFQMFPQAMVNLIYFEKGGMRTALTFGVMAGLYGLPGAEDAIDLTEAAVNAFRPGRTWNARLEARKMLNELEVDPNLITDGLSHNLPLFSQLVNLANGSEPVSQGEGIDLSGRLSLGKIIPFVGAVRGQSGTPEQRTGKAVLSAAGAVGSIFRQGQMALSSRDPSLISRLSHMFPSAIRQAMQAGSRTAMGGEYSSSGVKLRSLDLQNNLGTVLAKGLGLQSTISSRAIDQWYLVKQQSFAHQQLKSTLLQEYFKSQYYKNGETAENVLRAIRAYNLNAPPGMEITSKTLSESMKTRLNRINLEQRGYSYQKSQRAIWADVAKEWNSGLDFTRSRPSTQSVAQER